MAQSCEKKFCDNFSTGSDSNSITKNKGMIWANQISFLGDKKYD